MKRILLFTLLIFSATLFAQDISGIAYYQSKTTVDMNNIGGRDMSEDMRRQIAERIEETDALPVQGRREARYRRRSRLGDDDE